MVPFTTKTLGELTNSQRSAIAASIRGDKLSSLVAAEGNNNILDDGFLPDVHQPMTLSNEGGFVVGIQNINYSDDGDADLKPFDVGQTNDISDLLERGGSAI